MCLNKQLYIEQILKMYYFNVQPKRAHVVTILSQLSRDYVAGNSGLVLGVMEENMLSISITIVSKSISILTM